MDRIDAAIRQGLQGQMKAWERIVLALAAFLIAVLLCMKKQLLLAPQSGVHLLTAVFLSLPVLLVMLFHTGNRGRLWELGVAAGVVLALLLRIAFLDRDSGDFTFYLRDWLARLRGQSFSASMKDTVGEYHVLYQYILFLITRLPVPDLYAVKGISFLGDACLALAGARLAKRDDRALLLLLFLPSACLNGGMFAQCDSLYTAALLWGLVLCLEGRSAGGFACFALGLCFKLQAVFLLPICLVLWYREKARLSDVGVFLLTMLCIFLPALLGGKPASQLVSIYLGQTGIYTGLNYGAANFWALFETGGLDVYAYGLFGMALGLLSCVLLTLNGIHREEDGDIQLLGLSLLYPLCAVFFLPRMHERYFYMVEMLAWILTFRDRRYLPAAMAVSLALLCSLWESFLPLWACALLMLFALGWALGLYHKTESDGK